MTDVQVESTDKDCLEEGTKIKTESQSLPDCTKKPSDNRVLHAFGASANRCRRRARTGLARLQSP